MSETISITPCAEAAVGALRLYLATASIMVVIRVVRMELGRG